MEIWIKFEPASLGIEQFMLQYKVLTTAPWGSLSFTEDSLKNYQSPSALQFTWSSESSPLALLCALMVNTAGKALEKENSSSGIFCLKLPVLEREVSDRFWYLWWENKSKIPLFSLVYRNQMMWYQYQVVCIFLFLGTIVGISNEYPLEMLDCNTHIPLPSVVLVGTSKNCIPQHLEDIKWSMPTLAAPGGDLEGNRTPGTRGSITSISS